MRVLTTTAAVCVFVSPLVSAAVLHVPTGYPTVQAAVDAAAASGDTIRVAQGDYPEDVVVDSKDLAVIGAGEGITQISSMYLTTVPGYENPSGGLFRDFSLAGSFVADRLHRALTLENCSILGSASLEAYVGAEQLHLYDTALGGDLTVWGSLYPESQVLIFGCEVEGGFFCYADDPYISSLGVVGPASVYGSSACDLYSSQFNGLTASAGVFGAVVSACGINGTLEVSCAASPLWVVGNRVQGGDIVLVDAADCTVARNVVSGGTWGIDDWGSPDYRLWIEENTIVGCTASGIRVLQPRRLGFIQRNIVKGNAVGVVVPEGSNPSAFACNDVYDNAGGNWVGIADPSGTYGNFSLDPLFCSEPEGDLTLAATSPCLPGNHPDGGDCDRIGALDQGCSVPSDLAMASPGIRAGLRLVGSNPTQGPARVAVTLPSAARVSLEMIDASGREIATVADGWFPAGRHEMVWDGRGSQGEPLASGVYFLCLQGAHAAPPLRLVVLH